MLGGMWGAGKVVRKSSTEVRLTEKTHAETVSKLTIGYE